MKSTAIPQYLVREGGRGWKCVAIGWLQVGKGKLSLARRPVVLHRVRGAAALRNILLICVTVSRHGLDAFETELYEKQKN